MDTHAECHTAQPETGTDRRSHVFGELQTKPPDSVTDRDTLTRRYALPLRRAGQSEGAVGALRFVEAINGAGQRRFGPLEQAQRLHVRGPGDAKLNIQLFETPVAHDPQLDALRISA